MSLLTYGNWKYCRGGGVTNLGHNNFSNSNENQRGGGLIYCCHNILNPGPLQWELQTGGGFNILQSWYIETGVQYFIGGSLFSFLQRNIEPRFIILHDILNPGSIFCSIKLLYDTGFDSWSSNIFSLFLYNAPFQLQMVSSPFLIKQCTGICS